MLKLLICFVILYESCVCLQIQNLTGKWLINDLKGEYINLPANVPGGIYSDLMDNKIIEDIFYGYNDVNTRWVSERVWNYSKIFYVDNFLLNHVKINLILDGVDTFSKIDLNGATIGTTDNMFIRYEFDIKRYLKVGENVLTIQFLPSVSVANKLYTEHLKIYNYTIPPMCVPEIYNGECHVNHIRKMQASYAWDWGPAFPSVGIWKNIYIESFNSTIIRDVTISTELNKIMWDFSVTTYLAKTGLNQVNGTLVITIYTDIDTIHTIYPINSKRNTNNEYSFVHNFSIPSEHFKLWWPNGYGEQNLYQVKVTFCNPDNSEQSVKRFKIGFRTIELVQDRFASSGRLFYFRVNDIPIFMKGSNSIPIHILPEKAQNETSIRNLLEASRDVHMNMLRVWGGGSYESNTFYEIADELGILIWQDFMFACSMYPVNDAFLSTVKEEIKHQVRRLQHHASIAIWAGNNENEAALRQNWYGTASKFDRYHDDYKKLYVDTVKRVLFENDNTRSYLTSSPTNGIQSEKEDFVAKNPQSHLYGDVHFYNYIRDGWDQSVYPITRFASEYGYQSLPSVKTILTATRNISDLNINGEFLKHRQHHPLGYSEIKLLIKNRLKLPDTSDADKYNRAFIFYSQIFQAMAIKVETEFYRQWFCNVNSIGEGMTMGALYWQLNDVWVGPTWSSIDFNGNWKMLHYYAKEFFAPVIVTSHILPDRTMKIFVVSDLITPVYNATLTISTYNWNSFVPLKKENITLDILPGSSVKILEVWLEQYLVDAGCGILATAKHSCFMYYSLTGDNMVETPDNHNLIADPMMHTTIKNATVKIQSIEAINEYNFKIEITSDEIAAFVWLECDTAGTFSKNGFLQISNKTIIYFKSKLPTFVHVIMSSISVTHLLDNQYF